jgi:hypothetical protein
LVSISVIHLTSQLTLGQGCVIATVYGLALLSLYLIFTCRIVKALWDIIWAVYVLPAIFSARFEKTQVIREHNFVH